MCIHIYSRVSVLFSRLCRWVLSWIFGRLLHPLACWMLQEIIDAIHEVIHLALVHLMACADQVAAGLLPKTPQAHTLPRHLIVASAHSVKTRPRMTTHLGTRYLKTCTVQCSIPGLSMLMLCSMLPLRLKAPVKPHIQEPMAQETQQFKKDGVRMFCSQCAFHTCYRCSHFQPAAKDRQMQQDWKPVENSRTNIRAA